MTNYERNALQALKNSIGPMTSGNWFESCCDDVRALGIEFFLSEVTRLTEVGAVSVRAGLYSVNDHG